MTRRVYRSCDGRFAVQMTLRSWLSVRRACAVAGENGTGGVLIGEYRAHGELAVVTQATGPTRGADAGPTWFYRPAAGPQRHIDRAWGSPARRRYYLGEWHLHPSGPPVPSRRDLEQMAEIAASASYRCPEPVLIVEARPGPWPRRSVWVVPRDEQAVPLVPSRRPARSLA